MDSDTAEFFPTLFDSFKREMHQEFESFFARLHRIEARPELPEDPDCENWKAIEGWAARPSISARNVKRADI